MKRQYKIGMNRGKARLWLEGKILSESGFNKGDRFNAEFAEGRVTLQVSAEGTRTVSGHRDKPVIDLMSAELALVGDVGAVLDVQCTRQGRLLCKATGEVALPIAARKA